MDKKTGEVNEFRQFVDNKFGKDKLASVYIAKDGEVGILYGEEGALYYDAKAAKVVLDLICQALDSIKSR